MTLLLYSRAQDAEGRTQTSVLTELMKHATIKFVEGNVLNNIYSMSIESLKIS